MPFSFSFGFGPNNNHGPHAHNHGNPPTHFYGHHSVGPMEFGMVERGEGVFAYIEKSGFSYSGDVPGVGGIHRVILENSFDECLRKMTESVRNSIDVGFSSFRQKESYDQIKSSHPNAEIVFIRVK